MKRLIVLLVAGLVGCAAVPPKPPVARMPFPEKEYQALPASGSSTVRGQAFLKTRSGAVKLAAGNDVLLNPVTSYSTEWYEKNYLAGQPLEQPDPRLWNYVRKQVADGGGRFTFSNVPPGDYYVTTEVTWEAPTGYQGSLEVQGGSVTKRISVGVNGGYEIAG